MKKYKLLIFVVSLLTVFILISKSNADQERWERQEVESVIFKAELKGKVYINRENPNLLLLILDDKSYALNTMALWVSEISPSNIRYNRNGTVTLIQRKIIPSHNIRLEVKNLKDKVKYIITYRIGRKYEIIMPKPIPPLPKKLEIPFETILKDDYASNFSSRENIVIKNNKKWELVWNRIHEYRIGRSFILREKTLPLPFVDFNNQMIIAVFAGKKEGKGHSIKVEEIMREKDRLVVYIREETPQMRIIKVSLSYPFHIVKCKRIDLPVVFQYLSD
jgi:hypothetical protein